MTTELTPEQAARAEAASNRGHGEEVWTYAAAYPVRHSPYQQPGKPSIHNSYLFAVVDHMEYLDDVRQLSMSEGEDPEDLRAGIMLDEEYAPIFDQWYAF